MKIRNDLKVSALTSSLPATLSDAIEQLAALGFQWIDVPPVAAEDSVIKRISRLQLQVGCVGLERDQPEPFDLASSQPKSREKAVAYFCRAIERTAALGAPVGYLTPPTSSSDEVRKWWCDSLLELGDHAERCGIEVCIEHFPGRLVPTVRSTLELLESLNHKNLLLLLDVGHCLISGEDPAESIQSAGQRLGYIHFDDNDGVNDLHWGLLKGRLVESQIAATIDALESVKYDRTLCLEFNPIPECHVILREGKTLLERFIDS